MCSGLVGEKLQACVMEQDNSSAILELMSPDGVPVSNKLVDLGVAKFVKVILKFLFVPSFLKGCWDVMTEYLYAGT